MDKVCGVNWLRGEDMLLLNDGDSLDVSSGGVSGHSGGFGGYNVGRGSGGNHG